MELLKNRYNKTYIDNLCVDIQKVYKSFDIQEFTKTVLDSCWYRKELKSRMQTISFLLGVFLPQDYEKAIDILIKVYKLTDQTKSLENMIFQDFVETYGLDYFDISMRALEVFTINSSSEFAIRQFIIKYPTKTMKQMKIWAKSDIVDLRRLSCEGCRPRLPWAVALTSFKQNPTEIFEILNILKFDSEKYVLRSVANNLNDISKENPSMVIDFIRQNIGISNNLDYVLRHGSRTMLKNGDKEVLGVFGFGDTHSDIQNFVCDEVVKIGDKLNFGFDIVAKKLLGNLRIEYIIHYKLKNGKYGKKIYMIKQDNFDTKAICIQKSHHFRPISTRIYNTGKHSLDIVINGDTKISRQFVLS